ncbi:MAG: ribosomal-processing cysteine protease Prp [Bacilli bacterium]|nr:ribosomal-processing cysteine protease Prp [Bacilli bacterium]
MILVNYSKKNGNICLIESKGHANYEEAGKDIVCSAVSAIIVGGFNALNDEDLLDIIVEKGHAKCVVKGELSEHDYNVLDTMLIQLMTIEKSYPEFVKILEK